MNTSEIIKQVNQASVHDRQKSKDLGEVFTPKSLVKDMLRQLPKSVWKDPTKRWFDPCAGKGNFPAIVVHNLMAGLASIIPDETARYKHIIENMLYMSEYQVESCIVINKLFNPNGDLQLNLHVGDTLTMPSDFFDVAPEVRNFKYPDRVLT